MCNILENLYIGDINDACNNILKQKLNITHILTVESRPLSLQMIDGANYHYVHLLDMEDCDLLSHLPSCIQFMQQGRQHGAVLVHCFAGQSRSGAVVTAFLMKHLALSHEEALVFAKKMKPDIGPNHGFLSQLELFGEMGCELDDSHPAYKEFKLQILSSSIQNAQNPSQLIEKYLSQSKGCIDDRAVYKCKKCRHHLFAQSSVLAHVKDPSNVQIFKNKSNHHTKMVIKNKSSALKNRPAGLKISSLDECSTSLFLEPVHWMKDLIHELSGKFSCPKCSSKLGSWDWTGNQCACGKWLTPSFQVAASKVDLVTTLPHTNQPTNQPKITQTKYVFKE